MRDSSTRPLYHRLLALLTVMLVLFVQGCSKGDKGDPGEPGADATDDVATDFPAKDIDANSGSGDTLAFQERFAKVGNGQFNVFWNKGRDAAIVLYVDNFDHMWAHYYDGSDFSPPVELRGAMQDFDIENDDNRDPRVDDEDEIFVLFHVLWLNTANNPSSNAAARDGDALITWIAEEGIDGYNDDNDDLLWGTYFDMSRAGQAKTSDPNSDAEIRYGFYTEATQVNDNTAGTDVSNFGFISDSLCQSHDLFVDDTEGDDHVNQPVADLSGDRTTFAYIAFRQEQTTTDSDRFYCVEFNLTQIAAGLLSANRMPVQASSGAGEIPIPAGLTLGENVNNGFVVHNGDMLWRGQVTAPIQTSSNFLTRFDGSGKETILLSTDLLAPGEPTNETIAPLACNTYGGDHGLLSLYTFFTQNLSGIDSIYAAKSDLIGTLAREVSDIDAGAMDVDYFIVATRARLPLFSGTRIARNARWISVVWTQQVASQNGRIDHVHGNVVQTRNALDAGARTLAESVGTAAVVPNQDATLDIKTLSPGRDGLDNSPPIFPLVTIQYEVANGTYRPGRGFQSNVNRINFAFRQQTSTTFRTPDHLLHNGLIISLGAAATSPTYAFAEVGAFPAGRILDGVIMDVQEVVADSGSAGRPVIFYLAEDGNRDIRMYGIPILTGATPALISTAGAKDLNADVNRIRIHSTPVNSSASGSYGGDMLHVFFTEPPFIGGENPTSSLSDASGRSLRTRYFDKSAFLANLGSMTVDDAFKESFGPPLDENPNNLDHGFQQEDTQMPAHLPTTDNEEMGPPIAFATSSGNVVGIYFRTRLHDIAEGGHLYYQEFNGVSWIRNAVGDSDPQPIDNNNFSAVLFPGYDNAAYIFPPKGVDNTLSETIIAFAKPKVNDSAIGKERRWYVRVHE